MSALFSRSRSRHSNSEAQVSEEDGVTDPLLINTDTVIRVVDDEDDDHEDDDNIFCKSVQSVGGLGTHARHPRVRSVSGSKHKFTVINYDEEADDTSNVTLSPPLTIPSPRKRSVSPRRSPIRSSPITEDSKNYSKEEDKEKNRTESKLHKTKKESEEESKGSDSKVATDKRDKHIKTPHQHHASVIQRSLSLDQEQIIRKAMQNNNYLANIQTRFAGGDTAEDQVDQKEPVYKSWDWRKDLIGVARWGRLFGKRKQDRLVGKSGEYNIIHVNQEMKSKRYMLDIFTTLLEMRWRYTVLLLVLTFLCGWVVFALVWWGIAVAGNKYPLDSGEGAVVCVIGVHDFMTALLFSIETQQTIGYGTRAVTEQCPGAILLVMIQSVFGVVIQCILTGLVFAKLGRAKKRRETLMFSKNGVISRHRGQLCFMFQIADMRKAHMIGVSVHAVFVKQHRIAGQDMSQSMRQYKLELHTDADDFIFLAMPVRMIHIIDMQSPLYEMGPEQLLSEDFEIVVVLEGVNETTGMSTQVRTSYLPGEIMWGHKHGPLITNQRKNGIYNIDYTRFNDVVPVDTPELSASKLTVTKHTSLKSANIQPGVLGTSDNIPHL